jgi:hypothetical protein
MDLSFRSSSDKLSGETSKLATTSQEKFERIFLDTSPVHFCSILIWSDFNEINFSQLKNGINWAEKSVPFVLSNPKPEFNFKFWPDLSNKYWYFLFWNLILHFTGKQNFLGIHISFGRHYKPLSAISTSAHDNFWLSVMLNLIRAHYL